MGGAAKSKAEELAELCHVMSGKGSAEEVRECKVQRGKHLMACDWIVGPAAREALKR